jgi:hypothetical protein
MNAEQTKIATLRDYHELSNAYFSALRVREVFRIQQLAAEREGALRRLFAALLGREPTPEEIDQVQNGRNGECKPGSKKR